MKTLKPMSKRQREKTLDSLGSFPPIVARRRTPPPIQKRLSISERNVLLEYLARGWSPGVVLRKLKEEQQIVVSRDTLRSYREGCADEIAQRREVWLQQVRSLDPLTDQRSRLREYIRQYNACVEHMLKEPCPICLTTGFVIIKPPTKTNMAPEIIPVEKDGKPKRKIDLEDSPPPRKKKPSQDKAAASATGKKPDPDPPQNLLDLPIQLCPNCKGRKWALPPEAKILVKELDGDIRFDTLPELPASLHGEWMDRAQELLQRIREEVGDAWSPREKGQGANEQHLHLHGADAKAAAEALQQLLLASPEKIVEIYKTRKALAPQGGSHAD